MTKLTSAKSQGDMGIGCDDEIHTLLVCYKSNSYSEAACRPEMMELDACAQRALKNKVRVRMTRHMPWPLRPQLVPLWLSAAAAGAPAAWAAPRRHCARDPVACPDRASPHSRLVTLTHCTPPLLLLALPAPSPVLLVLCRAPTGDTARSIRLDTTHYDTRRRQSSGKVNAYRSEIKRRLVTQLARGTLTMTKKIR